MSTPDLVELIKAVGGALGTIIGAIGLLYARIAAKRSKEASQQTSTTTYTDGELRKRSAAEDSAYAVQLVQALKDQVDTYTGRQLLLEAEVVKRPGTGARRATPEPPPPEEAW